VDNLWISAGSRAANFSLALQFGTGAEANFSLALQFNTGAERVLAVV